MPVQKKRCDYLDPGEMNVFVTIAQPTADRDAYGGESTGLSTLANVWSKMEYGAGSEEYEGNRMIGFQRVEFTIYYRDDVTPKMTMVDDDGIEYLILACQPDNTKRYLKIVTEIRK